MTDHTLNASDVIAQIEEELTWRIQELVFLRNQLSFIDSTSKKMKFRKALVVMLYSYYEGFCKAAFQIYVNSINQANLTRDQVNDYIKTASLNQVFLAYHDEKKKDPYFRKSLPDDTKLHRYSRQVQFIQSFQEFLTDIVEIPDNVVDTEDNLKPVVLRKLLYRLGFSYDSFVDYESQIHLLLSTRNSVAHGAQKEGLTSEGYEKVEQAALTIMNELKTLIVNALLEEKYLKRTSV